jgi:hypothetical protein
MTPAAENREVSTGTKRFVERSSPLSRSFSQCRLLILGLLAFSACTGDAPSSALLAPRGTLASAAAGSVTVKSTSPDTATVDSTLRDLAPAGRSKVS